VRNGISPIGKQSDNTPRVLENNPGVLENNPGVL
jgi:hypothetical protein